MKKFNFPQKALVTVNALKVILSIFTTTFLTSHIVALNPDNILGQGIFNIGLLYISQFTVYIVVYLFLSNFVDRSNRVIFLRIGILVNCILLAGLIFFGETISKWIVLTGSLIGISEAFYNSSYLVMKNELVKRTNINTYNMVNIVLTNLINVIVPTILGLLIDVSTYSHIAIYIVVICVIQFGLSFMIQSRRPTASQFEIAKYFKYLKQDKFARSKLKYTYWNGLLAGFKNTYKVLIVILTIYAFKTNLSLGIFTSVFSLATMILLLIYKKFEYNPKLNKLALYLIIGLMPVIACAMFIAYPNKIILIMLNLFLTIAMHFSDYGSSSDRDAIIKQLNKYEFIAEHQFVFEACMAGGRIFSYAIFMVVGLFANITLFKILLIVLISTCPIKFFVMYKQAKARQELEELNQNNLVEEVLTNE